MHQCDPCSISIWLPLYCGSLVNRAPRKLRHRHTKWGAISWCHSGKHYIFALHTFRLMRRDLKRSLRRSELYFMCLLLSLLYILCRVFTATIPSVKTVTPWAERILPESFANGSTEYRS